MPARSVPQRAVVHEGAVSGRGMHLLDALATRWSTRPVAGGKVVWFELALTLTHSASCSISVIEPSVNR